MTTAATERVHLFGIRHHGPGSAASLLRALDEIAPAAVLVELPADAQDALGYAGAARMRPPVALLVHDAKEPSRASFYPFAEFSPEWQALRYAAARGLPVRAIDLPCSARWPVREDASDDGNTSPGEVDPPVDRDPLGPRDLLGHRDPLGMLAELAGYAGGEAWWDAVVESAPSAPAVFRAIADAMTALREAEGERAADAPSGERALELAREAHMAREVRRALEEFDGSIAVVVGAWHVPALAAPPTRARERELLTGLPKGRVVATWVPWTEPRLAAASGYGAGVASPGWYAHLWRAGGRGPDARVVAAWMSATARLLRAEGIGAPTSSAIDATRLALALGTIRGRSAPGLEEVLDATLAALAGGERAHVALVRRRLVVGTAVGEVDPGVPTMPLAEDLAREQRRLRMKPEALERQLAVDLRTDAGLAKSALLHRLDLLAVPWGRLEDARAGRGTFREVWRLEWTPELSVALAEAVRFGTTVESAAAGAARERAREHAHDVAFLARLVESCLLAALDGAAREALDALQRAAVATPALQSVMETIPPLIDVLRYGTARDLPSAAIQGLVETLFGQVLAGVDFAARGLDEEGALAFSATLAALHRAVETASDGLDRDGWLDALARIAADGLTAPRVRGVAARRVHDAGRWQPEEVDRRMGRELSAANDPSEGAAWLEGFLGEDAQVLLFEDALLRHVDEWLEERAPDEFEALLPILRRTFAAFDANERRSMLAAAANLGRGAVRPGPAAGEPVEHHPELAAAAPLVLRLLGLDRTSMQGGGGA